MTAPGTAREEHEAMEFSVTKSALLNELSTTQGVVERKTTIPILSNLLVEAKGSSLTITATDLELAFERLARPRSRKRAREPFLQRNYWSSFVCCPKARLRSSSLRITGWRSSATGRNTSSWAWPRKIFPRCRQCLTH